MTIILTVLLAAMSAWAVDRETIENLKFLLMQPGPIYWADMDIDDAVLIEGFTEIHAAAVIDDTEGLRAQVLWAMGETGFIDFVPILIDELETNQSTACYALGKISSDDGVEALIPMLDNEDMFVREAAIWALGSIPYTISMDESKELAKSSLETRLEAEEEDWLIDMINAAIVFIETGVAINPAFDSNINGMLL